jgi:protease I
MASVLQDKLIAILATDGVEQVELTEPMQALEQAGANIHLVSLKAGKIQGFKHLDKADTFAVDRTLDQVNADDYDALLLPGGVANPDTLRMDQRAVTFVRDFFAARKPIAAICHAPWLLVEADVVRHRFLTSWPSLKTDIVNAGGSWVVEPVRVDRGLVTSRKPADLPHFCSKMVEEFAEGIHREAQTTEVAKAAPTHARHDDTTDDHDAAVDISAADSFPASDPPSSLQVT